jgi:hypothetical protein
MTDKSQICEPIKSAINFLESKDFKLVSSILRDFHFNEYEIKLESNVFQDLTVQIPGIEKYDDQTYNCKCHWSSIYLNKTDIQPTKIKTVLPIDYYELIIETDNNKKYLFNPSELNLYEKHKFLAYPDKLRNFDPTEKSIKWNKGFEIQLSEIQKICKQLSKQEAKNKMITLSSKNNAPTEKHQTHHVYSIHLKPYNSEQLICLSESIQGGLGEMGGGHYYSIERLLKVESWKNHMIKSDCAWAIEIIESKNKEKVIVNNLVRTFLELKKKKR